jgi:hypothetical protein
VQIQAQGSDFQLSGLGRSYSTASCWEQLPGLQVRSHSASATTIRSTCEMPKGDPRQAKVVTTWALRGDKIYFDETGQYQFLSKEGACTASVRRTRLLLRIVSGERPEDSTAEGETTTSPKTTGANAEAAAPVDGAARTTTTACSGDEPVARVEVIPSSPLLRAGDKLDLVVRGLTKTGCPVRATPRLEFVQGRELVNETPDGAFQIKADAPSGDIEVRARIGDLTAETRVSVVSRAEIESLFKDSLLAPAEESGRAGPRATAVANETPATEPNRTPLLLGLFGGLASCVGAVAWLVLRARSRASSAAPVPSTRSNAENEMATAKTVSAESGAGSLHPGAGRVCPVCGARYSGSEAFCGSDGSRLVREN